MKMSKVVSNTTPKLTSGWLQNANIFQHLQRDALTLTRHQKNSKKYSNPLLRQDEAAAIVPLCEKHHS